MAWANGHSRTATREWRNLKRIAKQEKPFQCAKCGISGHDTPLQLDHITPHAEGGPDTLDNVQWMCDPCHLSKSIRESARGRARHYALGWHPREQHPALARLHRKK